ncbi:MAG TPA: hypothetical protein PLU17_14045, partial [Chitinophagaceae bacterium]|nr:hypothetical protein [Chitinophagaceae bacterium]
MKILISSIIFLFIVQFASAQGGIWTWMKGDTTGTSYYGIQGVASPNNNPPSKYQCAHSTDRLNNLWLFGGSSYADLWKYTISTNMWTWMKGDSTSSFGTAVYGTQGIASPLNNPGSTYIEGMLICDTFNNLWLLTGTDNILWKYEMATNNWTWMKGTPGNLAAVYGTMGVPNINNTPTTILENKTAWIDQNNDLWFMDNRNLIWRYTQNNNMWTWMKGDTNIITGVYGTKG